MGEGTNDQKKLLGNPEPKTQLGVCSEIFREIWGEGVFPGVLGWGRALWDSLHSNTYICVGENWLI